MISMTEQHSEIWRNHLRNSENHQMLTMPVPAENVSHNDSGGSQGRKRVALWRFFDVQGGNVQEVCDRSSTLA
jgi:hypothetical protein